MRPTWEELVVGLTALGGTGFIWAFGALSPWLSTLFVVSFLDYVSGSIAGCQTNDWRASVNAAGIARKIAVLGVLLLCHRIDLATVDSGNPGVLLALGTFWYLAHEITSFIQNLTKLNVPIFPGLKEASAAILERTGGSPSSAAAVTGAGEFLTIMCGRCGRKVQGLRTEIQTAGFYDMTTLPWAKYRRGPTETYICDPCMHVDPRYLADYPPINTNVIT